MSTRLSPATPPASMPAPMAAPNIRTNGPHVSSLADPSITIPVYVLLVTIGFFAFQGGWATLHGNEMSRQQSLFTAVNAATLTGFQQARAVNEYTAAGQGATFGLMLAGLLFSWIVGGAAVVRIARLPFTLAQLAFTALSLIGLAAGVGAIVGTDAYGAAWPGVYQAVAALANCGLGLRRPPAGQSWVALALLLPALAGGLGLPVLLEALTRIRRSPARTSAHFQAATGWSAGVYLAGAAALLLTLGLAGDTGWRAGWILAAREAINARSAGLPFQSAAEWPRATQWVVIALMLIGACPGGAGGGIKVTTLAVAVRGVRDTLAGRTAGRLFGIATVWIATYLSLLLLSLLVLVTTEPQMPADRLLFLAASALGNVGLSHDPVVVSNAGLYTLAVTMLAGRLLPVLVLWTIADENHPAERIAVG